MIPKNLEKISNFEGWDLILVFYKRNKHDIRSTDFGVKYSTKKYLSKFMWVNLRDFMIVNLTENKLINWETDLEFIILLKRNLPRKMYSYENILPRNYLSYIFEFQLFPFPFSLISGDSLMVSPSLLNYGRGTFLQKMPFMGEQILWGKFIGGLFYLGGLMIRSYQGGSSFTECIFQ